MPRKPDPAFDPDFAGSAQWAAIYRAYGLQIIPCYSPAEVKPGTAWKRPALSEWVPLQEALVSDATFGRWYDPQTGEHRNRRNMGILTGRASDNAYIIDLDTHKNQAAMDWWLAILEVHNSGLPLETPAQRTGGGGLQLLFRAPPGFIVPTNRTTIGVDIRGQGGFAVLPSSLHESGEYYEWLPGCAPWEIPILMSPDWLLEEVIRLVLAHGGTPGGGGGGKTNGGSSAADYDAFGHVIDGRETYMRDMIWAALIGYRVDSPIPPGLKEFEATWADYERNARPQQPVSGEANDAGLEREKRGLTLFRQKWAYALGEWHNEIAEAAKLRPPKDPTARFEQAAQQAEEKAKVDPAGTYELLDVAQIKALPDPKWLVTGLMVEQALGFVYGPPGCLKTFIALDLALSFACTLPSWWDKPIQRGGVVLYVTTEGVASFKFRIMAWESHRKTNADPSLFRLMRQPINFMQADDVGKLLATVQQAVDLWGPVAAVFVDTISRVLPGTDENLQKDMTVFVAACDAVRHRFGAVVVGLHHSSRSGNMRGSTVLGAAGDFVIEVQREPGAMTGAIFAEKIKDAEDGWTRPFRVTLVQVGVLGTQSSLVLDGTDQAADDGDDSAWPSRDICREILAAIDEHWRNGKPWCWSANSPRCAAKNIINRWDGIRLSVAEDILNKWHARGIIAEEVRDAKSHIKGYQKLIEI